MFAQTSALFRDTLDVFRHIDAHFTSWPQKVSGGEFDCNQLLNELLCSVDNFDARRSGFVLDKVFKFTLVISQIKL